MTPACGVCRELNRPVSKKIPTDNCPICKYKGPHADTLNGLTLCGNLQCSFKCSTKHWGRVQLTPIKEPESITRAQHMTGSLCNSCKDVTFWTTVCPNRDITNMLYQCRTCYDKESKL